MKKIFTFVGLCLLISACASPSLENERRQVLTATSEAPQEVNQVAVRLIHSPIVSSAIQRLLISEKINEIQSKVLDKRLKQLPEEDYAKIVATCSKAIEELILTRCDEVVMPILLVD